MQNPFRGFLHHPLGWAWLVALGMLAGVLVATALS